MFRKNSIFVKIFIPIIAIMLLQAAIVNILLFTSGTTETLINRCVFISTGLAVLVGGILIFIVIRNFYKPIRSFINQLQGDAETDIISESKTYEIDLLCKTINELVGRHKQIEKRIEQERQLYMLAFTNSADVFTEYDFSEDTLTSYYYKAPEHKARQEPTVVVINNLMTALDKTAEIFHIESLPDLAAMYQMDSQIGLEIRVRLDFFDHLTNMDVDNDDGYLWFATESIALYDIDGNRTKTVTAAKNITTQKLAERAAEEASRRDLTTGFFNREYGLKIGDDKLFCLNLISITNFDKLEVTYGKIFAGIFVSEFSIAIKKMLKEPDYAIRFGDNQFLIFCRRSGVYNNAILAAFDKVYAGEAADLELGIKIDVLADMAEAKNYPENPVSVFLDLTDKENITELALEFFERAPHMTSSVRALLGLIGRMFGLDAVIICSSSIKMGTNQIIHQWCSENATPVPEKIMKVMRTEFDWYNSLLDEEGSMVYTKRYRNLLLEKLLCITEASASIYCCSVFEADVDVGRVLFVSSNPEKVWTGEDRLPLYSIAKIISTYISAEKHRLASQAKSIILSRISQEINAPIGSIAADGAASLKKFTNNLEEINDILEISLLESGQLLQAEKKPFRLDDFVSEIDNLMRPVIEEKGIRFDVATEVMHLNVSGDTHRLKQVLVNLLNNAYKFTERGGFIGLIITEEKPWQFTFSVKDSGIGIPQDRHAFIFNPFHVNPADSPGENTEKKAGLGLTMSKNILLAMSSTIMFSSAPDMGSDFYFTVNLKPPEMNDINAERL
ncbi:MAG: ATP-binding protein [Firmicutes bacterium]|nr:ATP-binding protein [Bacillota bacterium]